jgi:hypothetical protein
VIFRLVDDQQPLDMAQNQREDDSAALSSRKIGNVLVISAVKQREGHIVLYGHRCYATEIGFLERDHCLSGAV